MITIDHMNPGQTARVQRIRVLGRLAQRLFELGVHEGTLVRVTAVAPLGDPIALRIGSSLLSMRRAEARQIDVTPG